VNLAPLSQIWAVRYVDTLPTTLQCLHADLYCRYCCCPHCKQACQQNNEDLQPSRWSAHFKYILRLHHHHQPSRGISNTVERQQAAARPHPGPLQEHLVKACPILHSDLDAVSKRLQGVPQHQGALYQQQQVAAGAGGIMMVGGGLRRMRAVLLDDDYEYCSTLGLATIMA
jgi:hypothetical protein